MSNTVKLQLSSLKATPVAHPFFAVCYYGDNVPEGVSEWVEKHKLRTKKAETGQTNIFIDESETPISELFHRRAPYGYMDGFSPNTNKELHVGHLSNFVLAKTLSKMGIAEKTVALLGDATAAGRDQQVTFEQAYSAYLSLCRKYGYDINGGIYFASKMALSDKDKQTLLVEGTGDYEGTLNFKVGDQFMVGVKSDGSTSYFYQDVAFARQLGKNGIYVTGSEQSEHFGKLSKLLEDFGQSIVHLPLGLVQVDGQKMSSSKGNATMLEDVLSKIEERFNGQSDVAWNVLSGFILKSRPDQQKNIKMELIGDPKRSPGLYLSYTMARLFSCVETPNYATEDKYWNKQLAYRDLCAYERISPNILLEALMDRAKLANEIYESEKIKGNIKLAKQVACILGDLCIGCETLGMYPVHSLRK